MTLYFGGLWVNIDKLKPNVSLTNVTLLSAYLVSDWLLFLLSFCVQRNIMKRRQCLIDFEVDGIGKETKEDHMFDVRYYPEEYLSDIQEEDSD